MQNDRLREGRLHDLLAGQHRLDAEPADQQALPPVVTESPQRSPWHDPVVIVEVIVIVLMAAFVLVVLLGLLALLALQAIFGAFEGGVPLLVGLQVP
jgi:hypothetical protein